MNARSCSAHEGSLVVVFTHSINNFLRCSSAAELMIWSIAAPNDGDGDGAEVESTGDGDGAEVESTLTLWYATGRVHLEAV